MAYKISREVADGDLPHYSKLLTIGTLVTDFKQYDEMIESFASGGLMGEAVEFIHINNANRNSGNATDSLNSLIRNAAGKYIILCHQDVVLIEDGIDVLMRRIEELNLIDPNWALAGNAGGSASGDLSIRISDRYGENQRVGRFPQRVVTLDENFIIVKRDKLLSFSSDLSGFHFYGADICLIAEMKGLTAYVIDFHLRHKGRGERTEEFFRSLSASEEKFGRIFRSRFVRTTCANIIVSGSPVARLAMKTYRYISHKALSLCSRVSRRL